MMTQILPKPITEPQAQKTVHIKFTPQIKDPDDWLECFDPAFKFWDIVKFIDLSVPDPEEWKEFRVVAMELYCPFGDAAATYLMDAPQWRYGLRNLKGSSELRWVGEEEIVLPQLAKHISFEDEF